MSGTLRRALREALLVAVAGTALSILFYGQPVVGHLGSRVLGWTGDPTIFVWAFAWWPHAIGHGLDPLTTHAVWPSTGFDVLWSSTVPGLSLLAAPITLLFGPTVAYNVVALSAPGLAGGAVHLLCRGLRARTAPAAAAGLLFAASPYEAATMMAHLHLSFVAPAVLAAAAVAWTVRAGRVTRWGVAATTAALALEFLIAPELYATAVLAGAVALLIAAALEPAWRPALAVAGRTTGAATALAAVVTAPLFLRMALHSPGRLYAPTDYSTDALNLLYPTSLTALRPPHSAEIAARFPGNISEQQGYLGLVVILLLVGLAAHPATRRRLRVPLAFLAVALVASFGPRLQLGGHGVLPLPMDAVGRLPLLENVLPARLSIFVWLSIGVVCALWLSERRSAWRWAAVAAAALSVLPAVGRPGQWYQPLPSTAFFTSGAYRQALRPGDRVLVVPHLTSDALRWQAEDGFRFSLAVGMLPEPPATRGRLSGPILDAPGSALPALMRASGANVVVFRPGAPRPPLAMVRALGLRTRRVDDVLVVRVPQRTSRTTLPVALRPSIRRSASAARSSGKCSPTIGRTAPEAMSRAISAPICRLTSGLAIT